MSLKGSFEKRISTRMNGITIYSFVLTNTEWLGSDTFDCMLCDAGGQQPWYYREQRLKAGESMRFDFDTVGWTWCQGDFFAILGRRDKIDKSWKLQLKEYRPGECPECHGTDRCGHCGGQGYSFSINGGVSQCPYCGGTGICQTCYIPRRKPVMSAQQQNPYMGSTRARHHRPTAVIQNEINDVRHQIEQIDWNWKMRQMSGQQVSYSLFQSENQLRYKLQLRLSKLELELAESYNSF